MIWALAALIAFLAASPPNELEQAVKALEVEDYTQAAPLLEKALEGDPANVEIRFNLAFAYSQLQQDDKAIEHYAKVVEQKPDLPQARLNLGMLLLRQNRPAEAVPHLEALGQTRPDDFRVQFYLAHALESSGKADQAIAPYQRAVELDPNSAEAALGLGRSLARAGRFEEAETNYRRAERLDPELTGQTLEFAEMLEHSGRKEQALALYQAYLASHAEAIAVRERAGLLLLDQKRYQEAIPLLEAAVAQDATAANRAALAEAYSLGDQPAKALPAWRAAVEADPGSAPLRIRYGNALLAAQLFDDAARNYHVALEKDPSLTDGWSGLAFSLYRLENYPGVLAALSELRRRSQEKPAAIFLAAITQDKLQMYTEAKGSYERFLATGSGLEDEEFQSRQRIKVIEKILQKKLGK
jgi:tetratricopeptide (TPR) repeat protein